MMHIKDELDLTVSMSRSRLYLWEVTLVPVLTLSMDNVVVRSKLVELQLTAEYGTTWCDFTQCDHRDMW